MFFGVVMRLSERKSEGWSIVLSNPREMGTFVFKTKMKRASCFRDFQTDRSIESINAAIRTDSLKREGRKRDEQVVNVHVISKLHSG